VVDSTGGFALIVGGAGASGAAYKLLRVSRPEKKYSREVGDYASGEMSPNLVFYCDRARDIEKGQVSDAVLS